MKNMKRRTFLRSAAAGSIAISHLAHSAENDKKLKFGLIGCGWYGMVDLKAALKIGGVEAIALCDVDSEHLQKNADETEKLQGRRPKTFKDYRELLETPGLDFVIISTPPQWHALPFIAACEKGLDMYCEKPLAYDIREGQAMVDAAQKCGRIIQIGFQRRQSGAVQAAKQYIQAGNAGKIIQVDAQIHYKSNILDTTVQEPPSSLDWNLWCGPAPRLGYCPQISHFAWRLEKEYGNGHMVDWGIHWIDAIRTILGESMPYNVQAAGGIYYFKDQITTPDILTAHFDFDQCPVVWRHRMFGATEFAPEINNGILFYGEKETIFVSDNKWVVIPKERNQERREMEAQTDAGALHMADFLQAVRRRIQPLCTPEDAFQSTAAVQLGMIAYSTGAKVVWDRKTKQITNCEKAAALLKRPYREPWIHPYKG
ncbi:MAG: gfo/Idh/MocA family oxidoreductase [Candidatus Omnitrophota bacterium]|jgi:predicted dehydrogenase|nr:MAG: gfo/Idh/MocA family oxidoreductase [Candidatus Omnitrophota bacterium]